jgi:hypothetical protein
VTRLESADVLLEDLGRASSQGVADMAPEEPDEFFQQFIVIPRHLRALDPQVRLVIGDKGAGKTQLFKALKFKEGRELLTEAAAKQGHARLPLERSTWLPGFEVHGTEFPPPDLIDGFVRGRPPEDVRLLWLGLLTRVLLSAAQVSKNSIPEPLSRTLQRAPWDLSALATELGNPPSQGPLFAMLDELDQRLANDDRYVFVVYDDLDRVSPAHWDVIRVALQGLIQFWAVYSRRWQRVRCKIFLRRDLFEHAALRGPDIAKIGWHPAELLWRPGDLYRLLFKRMANTSEAMRQYLSRGRLNLREDPLLKWVPTGENEEDFDSVVKHVFGSYMGPDPSKGMTLRWIPNHLKDGHGRIFPRPLLRLMEEAAAIERRDRKAERPRLVHYTALRAGLDRVSEFRVEELANEEFPWMRRVQRVLEQRPFHVPAERKEVLKALQIDWQHEDAKPPEQDPNALLDYLVELGIASIRTDKRIDVGDLYLKGLFLKRKGGVARPKPIGA